MSALYEPQPHTSARRQPSAALLSSPGIATSRVAPNAGALDVLQRGRAISISMRVMAIVGDASAGVLLSQLLYWTRRGTEVERREGWIFKTAAEWEAETGMSWKVQHRARDILVRQGLIEQRRQSMPARLEFRVCLGRLAQGLGAFEGADAGSFDLAALRARDGLAADAIAALLGPSYLFHATLTKAWPLHTAVLCSRLLMGSRLALGSPGMSDPRGTINTVSLPRSEWKRQTGLSRDHWQTARRNLEAAGVLLERQRNFPRRVDLAVNLPALERLMDSGLFDQPCAVPDMPSGEVVGSLASVLPAGHRRVAPQTEAGPCGQDRAIQAPPGEHHPNPPGQSPNPACSNRPIPPTPIGITKEITRTPTPTPPGRTARPCPSGRPPNAARMAILATMTGRIPAFGWWGGGSEYALEGQGTWSASSLPIPPASGLGPCCPQARAAIALTEVDATDPGEARTPRPGHAMRIEAPVATTQNAIEVGTPSVLDWPTAFTEEDRRHGRGHLAGLGAIVQQTLLDEIAWLSQGGKPIRSPVALLRTLANKAREGAFIPDGAHRVAEARRRALAAQRPAVQTTTPPTARPPPSGRAPEQGATGLPHDGPNDGPYQGPNGGAHLSQAAIDAIARLKAWRAGRSSA